MRLEQDNESLKMRLEQDNQSLKMRLEQDREAVEHERMLWRQDKERLESQLAAVQRRGENPDGADVAGTAPAKTEVTAGEPAQSGAEICDTPLSALTMSVEGIEGGIVDVIAAVKDLEKHVSLVCQLSEQQNNGERALKEILVYLQQLDKKVQGGKLKMTRRVNGTLMQLSRRIRWAQVSRCHTLALQAQTAWVRMLILRTCNQLIPLWHWL